MSNQSQTFPQNQNEIAFQHLELLKLSIQARIDDYDEFYKLHFMDPRISFFEKQKFRLRKLLHDSHFPITNANQELFYRELELKLVNPIESRSTKPTTPRQQSVKTTSQKTAQTQKLSKTPDQSKVIYSVKINKQDYDKMLEKKAKLKK